jgi:hypothetical protein
MEEDRCERLMLLGLYTGVIAFCLHAFIDINFAHASLMTFAMALTALFLARAQVSTAKAPTVTWHGMVIMVALVLAAVVAGLSTRLYTRDLALSRVQMINVTGEKPLQDRYKVAHHLLQAVPDAVTADRNPAPIALSAMKLIIDDIDAVNDYGVFYTPVPGDPRKVQKVDAGAPVPDNALFFVKRWSRMLRPTLEASLEWVQQLKRMDACFPHSPDLALEISYWYKLFAEPRFTPWVTDQPERFLRPLIDWSEEAVHRNPYSPDLRLNLARAHLAASRHTQNEEQREHLSQALVNFREAHLFAPSQAPYLDALVHYSEVVADAYREAGLPDLAERYRKQAVAARSDRDALVETLRAHARGEL